MSTCPLSLKAPTTHPFLHRASIVRNSLGKSDGGAAELSDEQTEQQYQKSLVDVPHYWRDEEGIEHVKHYTVEQNTPQQLLTLGKPEIPEGYFEWGGLLYSIDYISSIGRMDMCGQYQIPYYCPECGHTKAVKEYCKVKYCSNPKCITERRVLAWDRLTRLKIRNKVFFQFEIGSNRINRDELNDVVKYVIKKLPKKYKLLEQGQYKLNYLKVFDLGIKNINNTGAPYLHYHVAFTGVKVDTREFISDVRRILANINSRAVFSVGGWCTKKGLLSYFAKRMAGELGHKGEPIKFISDVLSLQEYFQMYYRKKSLGYHLGSLITSNAEVPEFVLRCPICKIPLIRGYSDIIPEVDGLDPPPITECEVVE